MFAVIVSAQDKPLRPVHTFSIVAFDSDHRRNGSGGDGDIARFRQFAVPITRSPDLFSATP
ncbi:MAG TPA: hypothetical protein VGK21_15955, partial [Candidatus Angelobacter sp.]